MASQNGRGASSTTPTGKQWDDLCRSVKESLMEEMGAESWYLLIATVLTVSPRPHLLADFWTHIITNGDFSSPELQPRLCERLGDLLLKQLPLIGAPQMLSALIPLAKVQTKTQKNGEEKKEDEEQRGELDIEEWSKIPFPLLHERGIQTITSIYGTLWPRIFSTFGPYRRTVGLHELGIVYGLYLSDFTYLSPLETELVAFTSIMCQGLHGPALWHVRGLGRVLGARGEDDEDATVKRAKDVVRGVKVAMAATVEFCGEDMVRRSGLDGTSGDGKGWPNVGDVVRDLGGWGED